MAIKGLPTGWVASDEAWGGPIDRNESTYVTGSVSIQWDSTATTSDFLYSSFFQVAQASEPVEPRVLNVWSTAKLTGVGADFAYDVEFYDEDKTTLLSTVAVAADAFQHTGWQRQGGVIEVPANSVWARLKIGLATTAPSGADLLVLDSIRVEKAKPFIRATSTPSPAITLSGTWQTITDWVYDTTTNGLTSEYNLITIPDGSEPWQGTTEGGSVVDGEHFLVHEAGFYNVRCSILLDEWVSGDVYQARLNLYSTDVVTVGHAVRHTIYGAPVYAGAALSRSSTVELPVTVEVSIPMDPYFTDFGGIGAWDVEIVRQAGSGTPDVYEAHCYAHKT